MKIKLILVFILLTTVVYADNVYIYGKDVELYSIDDLVSKYVLKGTDKAVTGIVKNYYEKDLIYEVPVVNGFENGKGVTYAFGKITSETFFKNGKYEGVRTFYVDGKIRSQLIYKDDNAISGYCIRKGKKSEYTEEELEDINDPHMGDIPCNLSD